MVEALHQVDMTSIYLLGGAMMAFSRSIKKEVRRAQEHRCACCGEEVAKLEVHHRVMAHQGGSDEIENAVGLCPPNVNGCHQIADRLAFGGIIFPQVHGKVEEDNYERVPN